MLNCPACGKIFEDIHLLGYGFNPEHRGLQQELRDFQQFRRQRNALIVEKINDRLSQRGLQPICYEKVAERAGGTIGRPHIAMELMAAGYAQSVEEAFVKYLTPCNIAKKFFPVDQAMALIHEAGGVAVLAHPPYISRDYNVMAALLDELSTMGMRGVEVYNNGANCDEIEWYLTQVRLRGLFATGGSDFHGIEDGGAELGKIRAIGAIPLPLLHDSSRRLSLSIQQNIDTASFEGCSMIVIRFEISVLPRQSRFLKKSILDFVAR